MCLQGGPGSDERAGDAIDILIAGSIPERAARGLRVLSGLFQQGHHITIIGYSRGAVIAAIVARFIRINGLPGRDSSLAQITDDVHALITDRGLSNADRIQAVKTILVLPRCYCDPVDHVVRAPLLPATVYKGLTPWMRSDPIAAAYCLARGFTVRSSDAEQTIVCYTADECRLLFSPFFLKGEPATQEEREKEDGVTHPADPICVTAVFPGNHADIGGVNGGIGRVCLRFVLRIVHQRGPLFVWRTGSPEAQEVADSLFNLDMESAPLVVERVNIGQFCEINNLGDEVRVAYDRDRGDTVISPGGIISLIAPGRRTFNHERVHWTLLYLENYRGYKPKANLNLNGRQYIA
ncbi:hypothetical protein ACEPAI_3358 [Sanghuangporus weigelae]